MVQKFNHLVFIILETQLHLWIRRKLIICFSRTFINVITHYYFYQCKTFVLFDTVPRASNKIWTLYLCYNLKGNLFRLLKRFSAMQSHTLMIAYNSCWGTLQMQFVFNRHQGDELVLIQTNSLSYLKTTNEQK